MRLLSLPRLGWPVPKKEGSQEVDEVTKLFYICSVFNWFHSAGRKIGIFPTLPFNAGVLLWLGNPSGEELELVFVWSVFLPASCKPGQHQPCSHQWVPCEPPALHTGLERGGALPLPWAPKGPNSFPLSVASLSAGVSQTLISRYHRLCGSPSPPGIFMDSWWDAGVTNFLQLSLASQIFCTLWQESCPPSSTPENGVWCVLCQDLMVVRSGHIMSNREISEHMYVSDFHSYKAVQPSSHSCGRMGVHLHLLTIF